MSDTQQSPPGAPGKTSDPTAGGDATVLNTNTGRTHAKMPQAPDDESTVLSARPAAPDAVDATRIYTQTGRTRVEDATSFSPTTGAVHGEHTRHEVEMASLLNDGERIIKNRFVLEQLLGSGGMGAVYKARDLRKVEARDRNPYVAIKVLNEDFQKHPDAFISLQREARKSQHLAHRNIVTVYDFDRDGDIVFMTMEYLEGEPLDKRLKSNKEKGVEGASDEDALTLTRGMCAALVRAHSEHIVHSDFKPGNVFVTNKGEAKVFDFGIARAVARSERHGQASEGDRTVFDAGDLGALTPAYASLEMLHGDEPDPRDDLYALAVVVYQLYSGKHPFDRLPADQVAQKKLKPVKPARLTSQQWKAVRRGLALKREDRTPDVETFLREFEYRAPVTVYVAAVVVMMLAAAVVWFAIQGPQIIEREKIVEKTTGVDRKTARVEFQMERVEEVFKQQPWRGNWEEKLYIEYQAYAALVGKGNPKLAALRQRVGALYLPRIAQLREAGQLDAADLAIRTAETRYAVAAEALANEKTLLAAAVEARRIEDARKAEEQKKAMAQMSAAQRKAAEAKLAAEMQKKAIAQAPGQSRVQAQLVRDKLACPGGNVNARAVGVAFNNLKALDGALAASLAPEYAKTMAACIVEQGQRDPAAAEQTRLVALQIFPGDAAIKSAVIGVGDACPRSLAGLGGRGLRATCRDALGAGGEGPRLVVIPAAGGVLSFAIGKYEVSIGEFNQYCRASGECGGIGGAAGLPATGVSLAQAQGYLRWLSKETQRSYRLPSQQEWLVAAKADGAPADDNRNCTLDSMGIKKGDALVPIDTGKQNAWGLVNHVGNAQEWAQAGGVLALGGARTDPIGECGIGTQRAHSGGADAVTGFRVARELR